MPEQTGYPPRHGSEPAADASTTAEISREIVKTYSEFYGRGPTKARTTWNGNLVVVLLEEIFTRAEMTLIEADNFEQVRSTRQALQDEVAPLLQAVIERITGLSVETYLGQVNGEGVACEVFVLSRDDRAPRPAAD